MASHFSLKGVLLPFEELSAKHYDKIVLSVVITAILFVAYRLVSLPDFIPVNDEIFELIFLEQNEYKNVFDLLLYDKKGQFHPGKQFLLYESFRKGLAVNEIRFLSLVAVSIFSITLLYVYSRTNPVSSVSVIAALPVILWSDYILHPIISGSLIFFSIQLIGLLVVFNSVLPTHYRIFGLVVSACFCFIGSGSGGQIVNLAVMIFVVVTFVKERSLKPIQIMTFLSCILSFLSYIFFVSGSLKSGVGIFSLLSLDVLYLIDNFFRFSYSYFFSIVGLKTFGSDFYLLSGFTLLFIFWRIFSTQCRIATIAYLIFVVGLLVTFVGLSGRWGIPVAVERADSWRFGVMSSFFVIALALDLPVLAGISRKFWGGFRYVSMVALFGLVVSALVWKEHQVERIWWAERARSAYFIQGIFPFDCKLVRFRRSLSDIECQALEAAYEKVILQRFPRNGRHKKLFKY